MRIERFWSSQLAFLAGVAASVGVTGIETARRRADLFDSPDLSERERIELVEFHAASVAEEQRLRHKLWAAAVAFAVGVVLSLVLF